MICIVVNRDLSPDELNEIRSFKGKSDYKFVFLKELSPDLDSMDFVKFDLPPEEKARINYEIFQKIIDFGDKIINNKRISEWMNIEKAGVWYYQRFRTYFYLLELTYEKAAIELLARDYEELHIYTGNNGLLNDLELSNEIVIKQGSNKTIKKKNYLSFFHYFLLVLFRYGVSILKINKLRKIKHVVLDHAIRQSCLDINTMKVVKDNYVLSYLFDKLDSEFLILSFVQMPGIFSESKFRLQKSHFTNNHKSKTWFYGEYILLRAIMSRKVRKKLRKASTTLYDIYNSIAGSNLSNEEKLILSHYRALHKSTMLYILKYFAHDRFFSRFSFRTISAIDENSPGVKSILDAAKNKNISTIGIQHGTISDLSIAYMYSKNDKEKRVMTDYTMLWGDKWRDILVNTGNFPEESIRITGQVRTDIIPKLLNVDKQNITEIAGEGKKIVAFASQPQPDARLRRQAALDVFGAVCEMENVFLIVKLHPGEKNDTSYYHDLAKESKCSNYKLMYDIDLFLLLSVCDIMITCYSTVGTETIYFNKPLIIHDPLKLDMGSYYKEGVAFQATNKSEMKNYTKKILNKELNISNVAYQDFISKNAYKIDSLAGERTIEYIKATE